MLSTSQRLPVMQNAFRRDRSRTVIDLNATMIKCSDKIDFIAIFIAKVDPTDTFILIREVLKGECFHSFCSKLANNVIE